MAKRVIVGLLLGGLFAALLVFGGIFRMAVFTAAAVTAVYEMGKLFKAGGRAPFLMPAYAFAALHYIIAARCGCAALMTVWLLCLMFAAAERIFSGERTAEDAVYSIFALCYPLALFGALALLVAPRGTAANSQLGMLLVFVCPLLGDMLAFFIGSFFGRRRLCPDISPRKTVEGSVGGVLGGVLGGLAAFLMQGLWGLSFALWPMLLTGLVCGGVGQIGDLFASVLKRWAGIKDYGSLFPGHGGIMDRLDSVLMCAPVVLAYMELCAAP